MRFEEQETQMMFVEWLQLIGIRFYNHSANEGKRSAQEGNKLKKMGMSKGYPDIEIPLPTKNHHGLFIEFKTQTGRISPDQKRWLEYLNRKGYVAKIARSFDEARKITTEYLKDER